MSRRERHPLVVKLKTGEYDGTDLMHAWLLIEAQQEENAKLREAAHMTIKAIGGECEVKECDLCIAYRATQTALGECDE